MAWPAHRFLRGFEHEYCRFSAGGVAMTTGPVSDIFEAQESTAELDS